MAGAIIGTMFAFSAYRMMYASIWDFRFNHIPLNRNAPFTYGAGGFGGFHGFHDTVFTRKAGWGTEESLAMGGAPFDASAHNMGSGRAGPRTSGIDHNGNGHQGGGGLFAHSHDNSIGRKRIGGEPGLATTKHEPVNTEHMV